MTDSTAKTRLQTATRNDPCPCGSGKKYKKCHLAEDEAQVHAELKKLEAEAAAARAEAIEAETAEPKEAPAGKAPGQGKRPTPLERPAKKSQALVRPPNLPRRGSV